MEPAVDAEGLNRAGQDRHCQPFTRGGQRYLSPGLPLTARMVTRLFFRITVS
jgi:hypothetical protein